MKSRNNNKIKQHLYAYNNNMLLKQFFSYFGIKVTAFSANNILTR